MSSQLHALADLPQRTIPRFSLNTRLGGSQSRYKHLWNEIYLLPLPAIEPSFLRHLVPSLVTVKVNKGWSLSLEARWGSLTPYRKNQHVKKSYWIQAYTCSTHGKSEKGIGTQFSSVNLKVIQQWGFLDEENNAHERSGFRKG